jgi:hypothetical protein
MQVMAQAWVMSSLTDKALLLGMVNFAAGIPTIALTMVGGSAADRYDKRKILIAAQVVQSILATILGTLVLTGHIQVWHVIVLAACLGVCIAFEMPAISALVPELVRRDQIATAVALDRSVFHGSLVGPSIAGMLVAWVAQPQLSTRTRSPFRARDRVDPAAGANHRHSRGRGAAPEWFQRRPAFVRQDRTILCSGPIANDHLHLPAFRDAAPHVKHLHLGPDRDGISHGGLGDRFAHGVARGVQRCPPPRFRFMTIAAVVVSIALFVAFGELYPYRRRHGHSRSAFRLTSTRRHHCAGTGAGAFARRICRLRVSFFGDAHCRLAHHRPSLRLDRHAHCSCFRRSSSAQARSSS